jgi:hypothetical protein
MRTGTTRYSAGDRLAVPALGKSHAVELSILPFP